MIINLLPSIDTTLSLTNNTVLVTVVGDAITQDIENWYVMLDGYDDMYRIAYFDGVSSISLDSPFLLATQTYSATLIKLDYKLNWNKDSVSYYVINDENRYVFYEENGNNTLSVALTPGVYTRSSLFIELADRLTAVSTNGVGYSVYTLASNYFKITSNGTSFSLFLDQPPSSALTTPDIWKALGMEQQSYTGSLSYTSVYVDGAILRITKPINTYRESSVAIAAAQDTNKIFLTDPLTFNNEFPLSRITGGTPTRFCILNHDKDGIMTIRFNQYVTELTRAELSYIPVQPTLQDSENNYPDLPTPYTKFLVYGAAYFLLLEKTDSKAEQYLAMAQAELKAMVNDNRKALSLGGNNYGKLVPRRNVGKFYGRGYY